MYQIKLTTPDGVETVRGAGYWRDAAREKFGDVRAKMTTQNASFTVALIDPDGEVELTHTQKKFCH
jgi:hypothetical protein